MTTKRILGEDGRTYVVSSDSDLASKVTKISSNYIHIDANVYDSFKDNLCVKLEKPEPLSIVGMKDIIIGKPS